MYTTFSILYHHITENCWRLSVCLPFSTAAGLLDSKAGCPSWGWTVLCPTGDFNKQMFKWLDEQYMENCPEEEEEEEDAQVGFWESAPTHFCPTVFSSFLLNLHLQSAQHCQDTKPQAAAEIRSSPAHLGSAGPRRSHIFWGKAESKAKNTDPSSPLTFCTCPPVQLSNYKQALLGHPYKLCRLFLCFPFYLSIKKALWKLLLSI